MEDEDLSNLNSEVTSLRQAFNDLEQRLVSIENKLVQPAQTTFSQKELPKVIISPPTLPDEQQKSTSSTHSQETKSETLEFTTPSVVSHTAAQDTVAKSNLEAEIGQYWLSKLGVTTLVVGIIFLILYSFQYFNAPIKLLIGSAVATGLILLGERIAKTEERRWYGHALMGGGWALGYFIVYAMYYIPDLQLISYYPVELALSLALCGGAMARAVECKSEVIAILSVSLAIFSICVSGPSLVSNLPIILIAAFASIVSVRQKWYTLFISLTLISFIAHISTSNESYSSPGQGESTSSLATLAYLLSLWSIFNGAMFFADEAEDTRRNRLTAVTCVNAISFLLCLMFLTEHYLTEQRSLLVGSAGLFYLAISPLLQRRKLKQLTTVNLLIGLTFINAALWMKFSNSSMVIFDLSELALLGVVGLEHDIKAFRWFAIPVSLGFFTRWFLDRFNEPSLQEFGLTSPKFVFVGILAVGIFSSIFWLYAKRKVVNPNRFRIPYRNFYYAFASFAALSLPSALEHKIWTVPCWSLEAILSAIASIVYGGTFLWFITIIDTVIASFSLLLTTNWLWTPILLVIALCYALYAFCRQKQLAPQPTNTKAVAMVAGNLILTVLLYAKLSTLWLSSGLALEGLTFLAAGLVLRERIFRISGLLVLALLTLKLLFVDLAQAGTLERIISFIASGLVFLVVSYGYSRFTEKFGISK